ncbi:hypothetical protein ABT392_16725 [Paucibacter sp. JuS9]|uniref:hypothetical protein n=1 Tax=Paucibacter sp. JuS9 TaxID=3228748 RepID=UPI0037567CBC
MWQRRSWILRACGSLGAWSSVVFLGGCASQPPRKLNASGQACLVLQRPRRLICSDALAPSVEAERDIRELGPVADAISVYLIRRRIGDVGGAVPMSIDGLRSLTVPPFSMARLRLSSGRHRLLLSWQGEEAALEIEGQAGSVRFIELYRSSGFWTSHGRYNWRLIEKENMACLALDSRVIADLDVRRPAST